MCVCVCTYSCMHMDAGAPGTLLCHSLHYFIETGSLIEPVSAPHSSGVIGPRSVTSFKLRSSRLHGKCSCPLGSSPVPTVGSFCRYTAL